MSRMARATVVLVTVTCLAVGIPVAIGATGGGEQAGFLSRIGGWADHIKDSVGYGSSPRESSETRYGSVELRRGTVVSTVSATGALAPVSTVLVGSQVSGQLKELFADFNTEVKRGQLIAQIDPLSFMNAVAQAEADVIVAKAAALKANFNLEDAEAEVVRKLALASSGSGTQADKTKALAVRNLARSQVEEARGLVKRAEATLKQARTELDRTEIRSPVDGIVIQRNVEAGQTMAASLQAPTLFTIAQDLRDMQVNASVDESEIGKIVPGQRVEFTVDAYPGRRFAGEVFQIRKSPQTSQNVVTYTVVVRAPNADLALLPGMTASARFIVAERKDVFVVPNTALRFKPPGAVAAGVHSRIWTTGPTGEFQSIAVRTGLTDGRLTEVLAEDLTLGTKVITGVVVERRAKSASRRLIGVH
jgi:HlyD family secretion protein